MNLVFRASQDPRTWDVYAVGSPGKRMSAEDLKEAIDNGTGEVLCVFYGVMEQAINGDEYRYIYTDTMGRVRVLDEAGDFSEAAEILDRDLQAATATKKLN